MKKNCASSWLFTKNFLVWHLQTLSFVRIQAIVASDYTQWHTHTHTHTHSVELPWKGIDSSQRSLHTHTTQNIHKRKTSMPSVGFENRNLSVRAATEFGVIVNYEMHILTKEATATNLIHFTWRSWRDWGKQHDTRGTVGVPKENETKHPSNSSQNAAALAKLPSLQRDREYPRRSHSWETKLRFEVCTSKSRVLLRHTRTRRKPHHYSGWIHTVWHENFQVR